MAQYKNLALYYDAVMPDSVAKIAKLKKYIPRGKLLDIGCGTGKVLEYFKNQGYDVWGLDNSESMLEIAKKRIPRKRLFKKEMTNLNLNKKFNTVICLFDTINHLTKFYQWKKFFQLVSKQLLTNGVFIFDMNTLEKLNHLNKKTIIKPHLKISIIRRKNIFYWNVATPLGAEIIKEKSFPIPKVLKALRPYFEIQKTIADNGRVYFVCSVLQ